MQSFIMINGNMFYQEQETVKRSSKWISAPFDANEIYTLSLPGLPLINVEKRVLQTFQNMNDKSWQIKG